MATLLFVHGTGVRGDTYDLCFQAMAEQVKKHLPGVTLAPCLWGDSLGATLANDGLSVPSYDANLPDPGAGEREVREREDVRWGLLYRDPLYELRSMAALRSAEEAEQDGEAAPAGPSPKVVLKQLRNLQLSDRVKQELARTKHDPAVQIDRAVRLLDAPVFEDALAARAMAAPAVWRPAVGRAFVAAWMHAATNSELPVISGELRDELYAEVVIELGGAPKAISDALGDMFLGLASWVATPIARRKRTVLTDATFPAAADVLLYQVRGKRLRDFIAARLTHLAPPVYILAHSLGGIASFELLAEGSETRVAGLITAGSQAPFLYEMDALATLRQGTKLPDSFPPWLNFYDLNDMLSYVGSGIFPQRIRDVELSSRQPFPQSHSSYWSDQKLWREIKAFMA